MSSTSFTFERNESFDINGSKYESKSGSVIVNDNMSENIVLNKIRATVTVEIEQCSMEPDDISLFVDGVEFYRYGRTYNTQTFTHVVPIGSRIAFDSNTNYRCSLYDGATGEFVRTSTIYTTYHSLIDGEFIVNGDCSFGILSSTEPM